MQISEGECESAWVMGGRYLKEECTGNFGGQPFNGMGITGYDNMMKKYVSSWIDNMGTGIEMSEGSVDAAHKLFTFHSMVNDPMTGKPGKVKMVSKVVDDNRHVFSYYGDQGGKELLQMEITYLRK